MGDLCDLVVCSIDGWCFLGEFGRLRIIRVRGCSILPLRGLTPSSEVGANENGQYFEETVSSALGRLRMIGRSNFNYHVILVTKDDFILSTF